jgi:hypothetical protein
MMTIVYIASTVISLICIFAIAQIFAIKTLLEDIKTLLSPTPVATTWEPE